MFRWVWLDAAEDDPLRPQLPPSRLDPVVHGSDVSISDVGPDGREYLFTYAPLSVTGERHAAIELTESAEPIAAFARSIRRRAIGLATISALLGAGVVFSLGFLMVGRPLHAIMGKVRRVGTGDLEAPLAVRGHDELAELAVSVNSMCDDLKDARERARNEAAERLKAIEQLRHSDRLATVGTLASGIAHELGTPLNVVSGRAGLIAKGALPPEDVGASAEIIRAQAVRMTAIIRKLLDFARHQAPAATVVNMHALLRGCTELLDSIAKKGGVEIELPGAGDLPPLSADPGQIQQVFTNLIVNAIQAMPEGGRIRIAMAAARARCPGAQETGEYLRIDVRDEGPGIAEENLRHVFDPFFTTKDVGEGTGLGLAIAYGIVSEHRGWIDVSSSPGDGSCFSVYLPVEKSKCPAES